MAKVTACTKKYRNKTDIAHIFGVSNPTVYRRVEGIKKEIGKRYNQYAILDNLISLA
ncbi:MAG: transposase family protein, partial [Dorea sp.]|nr:transposase family protein [Dorea sp.]